MKPPKSILDPAFSYTPAAKQDCAATFKRLRKEMRAAELEAEAATKRTVTTLVRKEAKS